jgi:hypothetical protein
MQFKITINNPGHNSKFLPKKTLSSLHTQYTTGVEWSKHGAVSGMAESSSKVPMPAYVLA